MEKFRCRISIEVPLGNGTFKQFTAGEAYEGEEISEDVLSAYFEPHTEEV